MNVSVKYVADMILLEWVTGFMLKPQLNVSCNNLKLKTLDTLQNYEIGCIV